MDPLSISASVAGLLALTSTIVSKGYALIKGLKGIVTDIEGLLREVSGLGGVLLGLGEHVKITKGTLAADLICKLLEGEASPESITGGLSRTSLQECERVLKLVEDMLKKLKKTNPVSRSLKWQSASAEIAELTTRLEHYKTTFILCLQLDTSSQLNQTINLQQEVITQLGYIRSDQKRVEKEVSNQRDAQRRADLLDWLGRSTSSKHEDSLRTRFGKSGEWLVQREEFSNWIGSNGPSFFWLNGIPGSGKSILVSTIIRHLQEFFEGDKTVGLAYLYIDFVQMQKLTAARLIGILVSQLLEQITTDNPDMSQAGLMQALSLFDTSHGHSKSLYPSLSQIEELFFSSASHFSRIFIIIDGIDEFEDRSELLEFFSHMTTIDIELKVFVASRSNPDLEIGFQYFQGITILPTDVDKDIEEYIRAKLPKVKNKMSFPMEQAIETLKQGAGGLFLWAVCQLEDLARSRTKVKSFTTLPRNLGAAYASILSRVDEEDRLMQRRILRLLLFAKRPLDLCEVVEGIAVDPDMHLQKELNQSLLIDESDIFDICGSLLRRSEFTGKIGLSHHSVREFLSSPTLRTGARNEFYIPNHESVELTTICLSYLSFQEFDRADFASKVDGEYVINAQLLRRNTGGAVVDNSFLEYAATSWWDHLPDSESEQDSLWPILSRFFDPTKGYFAHWVSIAQYIYDEYRYPTLMTPLHFCAKHGLYHLAYKLLVKGYDYDALTVDLRTPLHIALENRQNSIMELLLAFEASKDAVTRTGRHPLDLAIESGNEEAVQTLILAGTDVNACLPSGEFPLGIALENQWESVIVLLVEATNPDLFLPNGRTSLHVAAGVGSLTALNAMISAGWDLDKRDPNGWCVLHFAAHNGHTPALELLLSKKLDPKSEDVNGWTPLHAAIQQRHLNAADCLVRAENQRRQQYKITRSAGEGSGRRPVADEITRSAGEGSGRRPVADQTTRSVGEGSGRRPVADESRRLLVDHKYNIEANTRRPPTKTASMISKRNTIPSPLLIAVQGHFVAGVELLLKSIRSFSDMRECLLTAGTLKPEMEILQLLLGSAEPSDIKGCLDDVFVAHDTKTRLIFLRSLYTSYPGFQKHPIAHAITNQDIELLKAIMEEGENPDFMLGRTPVLQLAAKHGNYDAANYLLDHGATLKKDDKERNVLHVIAVQSEFTSEARCFVEKVLARGCDVYQLDFSKQSVFQMCILSGNVSYMQYLLSVREALVPQAQDDVLQAGFHARGGNLLHATAEKGSLAMMNYLLQSGDQGALPTNVFSIDSTNHASETPLSIAIQKERTEIVSLLLENGASVSIKDYLERTPLHWAAVGQGYSEYRPLLMITGADENALDKDGKTPAAIAQGMALYSMIVEPKPVKVLSLLEDGADANFAFNGQSLLHAATNVQSQKIMTHLLIYGAEINGKNCQGQTPLEIAKTKDNDLLVSFLIERGAKDGRTC